MTLRWKIEDTIFDSLYEADVWADSIGNEMYARLYDGYDTPDYKVAYSLAFRLAGMKGFRVFTKTMRDNDNNRRYKVWVEYS
ncbi:MULTISPECIES: hypothetical protein [Bacillales]|uniref:Uncharacterized protein n=1 Tax=Lysinibacillus louembei TaxID=1470088 RepID=A0ABZ0RUP5_9BACI|nr:MULTISPECIES: hypothetical protein [Bacillales]MCT6924982.1 hypothetical protein [Metasolibacillus sp.]MCT6942352.1 hypothetical protein [Metasolibacillus sp.]WPK11215.1 hypothetical protein R6U77_15165 [Lysinibacillus louembei]